MRLIDAVALMEDIQKTITEQSGTIDWLNLISRQPTAYYVDNVVYELKEQAEKYRNAEKVKDGHSIGVFAFEALGFEKSIEIVRAEEHEQISECMEELEALRYEANEWRKAGYANGYSDGYNKAIDDFSNKLKTYNHCENRVNIDVCAYSDDCRFCTYVVGKGHVCMLDDISEQLKEGGVDAGSI